MGAVFCVVLLPLRGSGGSYMKLIFCKHCEDIYKLSFEKHTCACGMTWGYYEEDGLHAHYGGETAVPMGISNLSLIKAIVLQPATGTGERFEAFVIPKACSTMLFESE